MSNNNWIVFSIEEIKSDVPNALAMGPFGSNITKDNFVESGVPVIRGGNLSDGRFLYEGFVYLTEEKADQLRASNAIPGDLVFTHRGTLGQVGIIPKAIYRRFVVSQSQMKLTCDRNKVNPLFLYYYFCGIGNDELLKHKSGSDVPAIASPLTTLKSIKVNLPPLPIQDKIAGILSAYDDLIENNTRRIRILEEMAQAIYREWFVHFRYPGHKSVPLVESELGLIPQGWEVVKIREVSSYINRGVSPTYDESSPSIVINQKCIRDGQLNIELARNHSTKVLPSKMVKFGDVLINSTGVGTLGRVTQVYQTLSDTTVDSHVTIVRPSEKVSIEYFGYYLLGLQEFFDHSGAGSTNQTELGRQIISNKEFLNPPIDIQKAFSEVVQPVKKSINNLQIRNKNLRQQRDLLLPRLVSGELDVEKIMGQ